MKLKRTVSNDHWNEIRSTPLGGAKFFSDKISELAETCMDIKKLLKTIFLQLSEDNWTAAVRLLQASECPLAGDLKAFLMCLAFLHGRYFEEAQALEDQFSHWHKAVINIVIGVKKLCTSESLEEVDKGRAYISAFRKEVKEEDKVGEADNSVGSPDESLFSRLCGMYEYTECLQDSLFVPLETEWKKLIGKLQKAEKKFAVEASKSCKFENTK